MSTVVMSGGVGRLTALSIEVHMVYVDYRNRDNVVSQGFIMVTILVRI